MSEWSPIVVAFIALIGAGFSLAGTVIMALANLRGSQLQASDEIASGSRQLLEEYRKERERQKAEIMLMRRQIESLQIKLNELESWKGDVIDFIMPFIEGSKRNERQIIEADMIPNYKLPQLPKWLHVQGE